MSAWKEVNIDWSDAKVVPAIRYPSAWIGSDSESTQSKEIVFATVESFNPRASTPGDILDSLNNHNQGNLERPARYTFDIVVMPYGDGFDLITKCQNGRRYFDLILMAAEDFDGTQDPSKDVGLPTTPWSPVRVVFEGCKVRDQNHRYSTGGKPLVTFSCTALRYRFNQSTAVNIQLGSGFKGINATDVELGL